MNNKAKHPNYRPAFLRMFRRDLFELAICIVLAALFVLLSSGAAFAQGNVGINNAAPHAKSLLDLTSSDKGLLSPRMTSLQRIAMFPAPDATAKGMLVYQTDGVQGFYYYDGAAWVMVQNGGAGWSLTGNTGTNPANNFVGTTDAQALVVRTDNAERMRVAANGNLGIGTNTPATKVDVVADQAAAMAMTVRNMNVGGWSGTNYVSSTGAGNAAVGYDNASQNGFFGTTTAHPITFITNWAERMRIAPNGNVGIGSTNPVSKLQVTRSAAGFAPNADAVFTAENTGPAYMNLLSGTSETGLLFGASNDPQSGGVLYNTGSLTNGMQFRTGGNVGRLFITNTGDVTVGSGAYWPGYKFGVIANQPSAMSVMHNQNAAGFSGTHFTNNTQSVTSHFGTGNTAAPLWANMGYAGTVTAHPFVLTTADQERMRIDAAGNVGIGTATPGRKLDVLDAGAGLVARFKGTNAAAYSVLHIMRSDDVGAHVGFFNPGLALPMAGNFVMGTFGNAPVSLTVNNAERMHLATNGNVGVGTAAPTTRLHVVADQAAGMAMTVQNTSATGWSGTDYRSNTGAGNATVGYDNNTQNGFFGTTTAHPVTFITSWAERMRIAANGNVGIGNAAPSSLLHVSRGAAGFAPNANSALTVEHSGNAYASLLTASGETGLLFGGAGAAEHGGILYQNAGGMSLRTGGNVERIRINAAGNVGIGTATPTTKLEVNGFTKLGTDAPAIKVKKLTGTTAATEGGTAGIAHGLTVGKIIGVQVLVEYSAGNWVPNGYTINPEYQVDYVVGATNVTLYNQNTNSGNVLSKPVKILVTYEE